MLSLINIALRRGTELLFEDVSLTINQGRKIGIIGANGAGKTSLFRMITGQLDSDRGDIDMPAGTRIAWLEQEVAATAEPAVDYVLGGDERLTRIESGLREAEASEHFEDIAHLHDELAAIDGYTARSRAEQLMAGLGFSQDEVERPLGEFSGGWRIRLNLARVLMAPSDLLLLDEPTNHLDLDAIMWLGQWIRQYQGTLLLISHDREFLDETVDGIAYLYQQRIELFTGNYSRFEVVKAERLAEQQSNFEKQQREIQHMQDFVRRFRAKATKARQAQSRIKALARMELIAPAHIDSPFKFQIPSTDKVSSPLLSLDQAVLGYGDEVVLREVRLSLEPGDRLGLLGHNGAGKSTLVKTLRGELPLLDGIRQEGQNLEVGYFSQHQVDDLDLRLTALQHISQLDPGLTEQQVRDFLGGFDFRGDKVKAPISTFSGGEKARLALAVVAHSRPNLLLLDEPTNHLDMDMRQALTVALQEFYGAIVLISHDRHLLANTVDEFLLVDHGAVQRYDGDLDDYRRRLLGDAREAPASASPVPDAASNAANPTHRTPSSAPPSRGQKSHTDRKQARQLRTRISTIEKRLARLQEKLSEVETALGDPDLYSGADGKDPQPLLRDQAGLVEEIGTLEEEWLVLCESLEAVDAAG